ncbi:hypothetical protein CTI12_AA609870 [Artemisia annua]|uniref:Replication factor A C-terminal domain-containing protein n=1 Tax=Artemisia annua TaxID=35608 RepID=A0A2U1KFB4_ARTAN|nr:hypothetical protein CTI12_AA609870 [Artemisia annua]
MSFNIAKEENPFGAQPMDCTNGSVVPQNISVQNIPDQNTCSLTRKKRCQKIVESDGRYGNIQDKQDSFKSNMLLKEYNALYNAQDTYGLTHSNSKGKRHRMESLLNHESGNNHNIPDSCVASTSASAAPSQENSKYTNTCHKMTKNKENAGLRKKNSGTMITESNNMHHGCSTSATLNGDFQNNSNLSILHDSITGVSSAPPSTTCDFAQTFNPTKTSKGSFFNADVSSLYIDLGDPDQKCQYCNACFWYGERLKGTDARRRPTFNRCCGGGQIYFEPEREPPQYLKEMLFRTARDKHNEGAVPEFKIQLYNVVGGRQYNLPTSGTLGAIVFEESSNSQTEYDVIIEYKNRDAKRINKLHSSYMSLQFPLLFVYGQPGYNTKMELNGVNVRRQRKKISMKEFYTYQLHQRMTEADIRDLTPTSRNKILNAKIYRAWIHRDPPDTTDKDYIGCYISSTDKDRVGNPNRNQSVFRKVEIQNLNRNSIELTLWGSLAETFNKEGIDALEKPVIIAVTSCRVSRYQNNLQLSSTPATYYYINPTIPELEQYKQEYRTMFNINPPLQVIRQPFHDKEKEKTRNRFPLASLMVQVPLSYKGVRFTCDATITGLNTDREWYYMSCNECLNKLETDEDTYQCKAHGHVASPNHRYNFKAYISDQTQTVMLTCFTPKADKIVGINCETLVASLANQDPKEFPPEITTIIGKRHIFQFHYNTPGKQSAPDFILNDILDIEDPPKQLEAEASGSPSKHKHTLHTESTTSSMALIKTESLPTEIPNTPRSTIVTPKKQNETPTVVQPSQGGTDVTPPPPTDTFTTPNTPSDTVTKDTTQPKVSKRALFQDKPSAEKKNKKE